MKPHLGKAALLLALIAAIVWAGTNSQHLSIEAIRQWMDDAGGLAPLAFILLYALATVLFLPGSLLTLAGGALFGPIAGTVINLAGATLGATLAFLVARYLGGEWVERRAGGIARRVLEGVNAEGWRFVAFTRLVPVFPFNLLNYALGLTRIPLGAYVLTTALAMIPGATAYTYLGYLGREAAQGAQDLAGKALLALGLLTLVAFLPRLIARLRQEPPLTVVQLKDALEHGRIDLLIDVRSEEEYAQGHIPQARNIPLDRLGDRLEELAPYQEKRIALICRSDRRSHNAAQRLARAGFAHVRVVSGGMEEWQAKGWIVSRREAAEKTV